MSSIVDLPDDGHNHLCLSQHCGICGSTTTLHERVLALLGNECSTGFLSYTDVFLFPKYGHIIQDVNGMALCQSDNCERCLLSPEAVTMHADCWLLLRQKCDSEDLLQRLWIFAAWRNPWRCGPTLVIKNTYITIPDISAVGGYLLPMLRRLPPEIVQIIREFSADSLLWRFGLALGFFQRLSSSSTPGDSVSIPLNDCLMWERDSLSAPIVCSESRPEFIRLTIDSFGIKRIERLASVPPYNPQPSKRLRFVMTTETLASPVVTHFKFGALRLEFPDVKYTYPTWDTETCPPLIDRISLFRMPSSNFGCQYRTINLRKITGITFFFARGNILHIHAHTANAPTAIETWRLLAPSCRPLATWIYMPVSPNDHIITFGPPVEALNRGRAGHSDDELSFLFRLRLAGDVVVGPYQDNQRFALTELPIASLIYNDPNFNALSLIGTVLEDTAKPLRVVPVSPPWPGPEQLSFNNAYFSTAPLSNVTRAVVFNDPDSGFCRGILLDYEDGAERALGQCRVGIDSATTYSRPTHICYRRIAYCLPGKEYWMKAIIVECTDKGDHDHEDEDWICHSTSYEVDFWFDHEQVNIFFCIYE